LSVDTSFKHIKPRAHILVSCTVAALLMATLTAAGIWSLGFGVSGEKFGDTFFPTEGIVWSFCLGLWLGWGIFFFFFFSKFFRSRAPPRLLAPERQRPRALDRRPLPHHR